MQTFRTVVDTQKNTNQISHKSQILMLGSCFTENIGQRLLELKFNVNVNPFGIIFNPISVANSIDRLISGTPYTEKDLFFYNEAWHSYMHHSRFSDANIHTCLNQINSNLEFSNGKLPETEYLILTFGTSWVFVHNAYNSVVSNCHKVPASHFTRRILNVSEIVECYQLIINKLKTIQPNLKVILTLSPVRHLKDGADGNQVSKAILRLAIHELCSLGLAEYFPSYEIMLDDLRDYRFYNTDMVHPSEQAIDYIFEKFSASYFNTDTLKLNQEISSIRTACKHRPSNTESNAYKTFTKNILNKIATIESVTNNIDFTDEKLILTNSK
jgi:hypothetical protein